MAFGAKTKEQILAETFPGKTEEQIKEMLASFEEIKTKAAKVDTLETNFATANTELAQVREKLTALEAGNRNNNNNNNNNNNQNEPDYNWAEDADDAFNKRAKPLVGMTLGLQAELVYDRVVGKLEKEDPYFPVLRKEWDEMLGKEKNLQNKASQLYIENCYNVVFARHRNEIFRDRDAKSGTYFIETGRNQANNNTNVNIVDNSKTLSDEEKKEAAKFGVSPEKWLETRNKMKFVGGGVAIS